MDHRQRPLQNIPITSTATTTSTCASHTAMTTYPVRVFGFGSSLDKYGATAR
jgi:hypothetical protein